MRPCVGIPDVSPPLCQWYQLEDGTYGLADVERFNQALSEALTAYLKAKESQ